jgi:ribonuclease HI
MKLDVLSTEIQPEWTWVKGHAGIELNERCDQLVQEAIAGHGGK